jgi:hypothetical protein
MQERSATSYGDVRHAFVMQGPANLLEPLARNSFRRWEQIGPYFQFSRSKGTPMRFSVFTCAALLICAPLSARNSSQSPANVERKHQSGSTSACLA